MVLKIMPNKAEGLDRESVTEELIRRFSVWAGDDSSLEDQSGHEPWLTSERKKDWRYWQRYREWQEFKLPLSAMEALDRTTDKVLSMLEDLNEMALGTGVGWWLAMYSRARPVTTQV